MPINATAEDRVREALKLYEPELLPGAVEQLAKQWAPQLSGDLHTYVARRLSVTAQAGPFRDPEFAGHRLADGRPMAPFRAALTRFAKAGIIRSDAVDPLYSQWAAEFAHVNPDHLHERIASRLQKRENWGRLQQSPAIPAAEQAAVALLAEHFAEEVPAAARAELARENAQWGHSSAELVRRVARSLSNPVMAERMGCKPVEAGDWRHSAAPLQAQEQRTAAERVASGQSRAFL